MWRKHLCLVLITLGLAGLAVAGAGERPAPVDDLWIHPRNDEYDPQRHYKDSAGELYYHAENDIARGLGAIVVHGGSEPVVTADLGADLWEFVERNSGFLRPVLHFDSDADGRVDRSVHGRVEKRGARFDSAQLSEVDWRQGRWQLGVVYKKGTGGVPQADGRYLASVDSESAKVEFPRIEELAPVGAGPSAGLVIFKHREGKPIDLAEFAGNPGRYLGDFDELTRAKDADDWTVKETKGRLRTHFDREDLLLVRTSGGATLSVKWGDMPLVEFLEKRLAVRPDADGCYSTLESALAGEDGSHAPLPHRLLYCPEDSLALFDAPDGYQIYLTAHVGSEAIERTEASTSILDNVRLYAQQIYRRSPRTRATGSVSGNFRKSFADAGSDLTDMARHLLTGSERRDVHTGQMVRRTPALAAVPMFLGNLARLKPLAATGELIEGVQSGVQVGADAVSAVNNAVVNPLLQTTVGVAVSPDAADTAGHWFGALGQAASQNFPASERSTDALNPLSLWFHNRAFWPLAYTRTDTQLNIDRVFALANIYGLYAIVSAGGGNSSGGSGQASSSSTQPASSAPPATPTPTVTPPTAPVSFCKGFWWFRF